MATKSPTPKAEQSVVPQLPDVEDDDQEKLYTDMENAVSEARKSTETGPNMEAWRGKVPWFERRAEQAQDQSETAYGKSVAIIIREKRAGAMDSVSSFSIYNI
jgi:hypothetical protein